MPTHTSFKGVSTHADALMSDQLEANLVQFFNWSALGVGAFSNVSLGQSGCYGGEQSRLRPVDDPNYEAGTVWQGFRKDWVWESGVDWSVQPIRVSGVYVEGSFLPLNSGVVVDYPNGRVVFPSPLDIDSDVRAEFSYRHYQLATADSAAWHQVQTGSFRADDSHFSQYGSGVWDVLARTRVQLPAIFVEAVPDATRFPKEIGGSAAVVRQTVLFHVLAEDRHHAKWAHDVLTAQREKRLMGFDKNLLLLNDAFPLSESGSPRPGALMYPDMVKPTGDGGFYWEQIRFAETRGVPQQRIGELWFCSVRATMEVDRPA